MRAPALPAPRTAARARPVHPAWLRLTHWLNAAAVAVMMASGWRIYDASPLLDLRIPHALTLGGWLGGALQWHFAAMWLLVGNGIAYLALNAASGRALRRFIRGVMLKGNEWPALWQHLWPLLLFTAVVLAVGLKRFRRTLD